MSFSETFNNYLSQINVSYSRVAKTAGLSVSAVARYKHGEREPAYDSVSLQKLAHALHLHAQERGLTLREEDILRDLRQSLKGYLTVSYDTFLRNLNTLLHTLDIHGSELARALSFDPSHISKILSGQRRAGNLGEFTANIGLFLSRRCDNPNDIASLAQLLKCKEQELQTPREVCDAVTKWLGTNAAFADDNPIGHFLEKMDDFSLDAFINTIHFNDIKLPSLPFQLPTNKTYGSLEGMMKCELDFLKATVLSKSTQDCILYSDMPLEEMAKDKEFPKKWMFGMAMLLKKGLHLNIIHDVNRPFSEMMLGLEGNIPMYMTGQIAPWYLPSQQNDVFLHLLKVSGAAAMEGSAIAGHHDEGRYLLTKNEEDVRFYRRKAERLLAKAKPLMDIYRSNRRHALSEALKRSWQSGNRFTVAASLPLYTLSRDTLREILDRNRVTAHEAEKIEQFRRSALEMVEAFLAHGRLTLSVPDPTREQFEQAPVNLALAEIFYEADIPYRFEEYQAHLHATEAFAAAHPNLTLSRNPSPVFRNITYSVIGSSQVIVSKNKSPTIHFIIHQKKMVKAFQSFMPPFKDNEN